MEENSSFSSFDAIYAHLATKPSYVEQGMVLQFIYDLHLLMEEQGISRKELADRLGTSKAYVTKVLSNNANFTAATMSRLVHALDGEIHLKITHRDKKAHFCQGETTLCPYASKPWSISEPIPISTLSKARLSYSQDYEQMACLNEEIAL